MRSAGLSCWRDSGRLDSLCLGRGSIDICNGLRCDVIAGGGRRGIVPAATSGQSQTRRGEN